MLNTVLCENLKMNKFQKLFRKWSSDPTRFVHNDGKPSVWVNSTANTDILKDTFFSVDLWD